MGHYLIYILYNHYVSLNSYIVVARFTKCSFVIDDSALYMNNYIIYNCGFVLPLTCIHLCILDHQIRKVVYNCKFEECLHIASI